MPLIAAMKPPPSLLKILVLLGQAIVLREAFRLKTRVGRLAGR
jgi:hypothetical protein